MESTEGYSLRLTEHARKQIEAKGFTESDVEFAFSNFEKLYPNKKFEGQWRVVGKGLCLVGKPQGKMFTIFTIYEDGVMTPPRPDQLLTPEGKRYARLYNKAQRTGKARRQGEYWPRVHARTSDVGHSHIK